MTNQFIVPRVAHSFLIVLGLIALVASWRAVSNYVGSLESVRSLQLELTDVRRATTDSTRLIVHFTLHNRSPLPVKLNSYFFDLYLNDKRIGGSSSTWRDDDSVVDWSLYTRASTIEQTLPPHSSLDMEFPLDVFNLDQIMAGYQGGSPPLNWTAKAGLRLIHPHAHDESLLRMQAALPEPKQ